MTLNEAEFWSELYAVPFFNQTGVVVLNGGDKADFINRIEGRLKDYLSAGSFFSKLVILADKWEPASAELGRIASKKAWIVEYKPVTDEELPRWIAGQLDIHQKNISPVDARLLAEKTGNDLSRIDAVLKKLILFHKDSRTISSESISDFVDEERDFDIKELTNAVVGRRPARALKIAEQLLSKGESINKIMGFLRVGLANSAKYSGNYVLLLSYYNKLLSADLAVKTGRMQEEAALKTLIVKLIK
jgi:DNA polymerase III delta subunit